MIRIKANTRELETYLQGLIKDQLPFALSLATNTLAEEFVEVEQQGIELRFTVRRPNYILSSVQRTRGTKAAPEVRAFIDPERDILAKFELGGRRIPHPFGSRTVLGSWAIPVYLNATKEDGTINPSLLPSNLGLSTMRRLGKFGATEFKRARVSKRAGQSPGLRGKRRTFVIPPGTSPGLPGGGIFRRVGPGRRDIEALFLLKPSVPIPPSLEFERTGKRVADEQWENHMTDALDRALKSAR